MDDPRSVIERSLTRVESESYTLESFYRRRDRKRTRQRLAAGIVGLAIAIVIAVAGSAILRSAPEKSPAGTRGTPILREGEVLQVVDRSVLPRHWSPRTPRRDISASCMAAAVVVDGIQEFAPSTDGGWIAWEESCGVRRMRHDRGWTVGGRRGGIHDPRDVVGSSTGSTWWLDLGVVTCC